MSGAPALLRTATADDLEVMRSIAVAAFDRDHVEPGAIIDLLHHRPQVAQDLQVVACDAASGAVVGLAFASLHEGTGFLDAIAVQDRERRRGHGSALVTEVQARLGAHGARSLQVGGNTWYYAWPGVDVSYTPALCLLESAGYERFDLAFNMDVDLHNQPAPPPGGDSRSAGDRAPGALYVARAQPGDWAQLGELLAEQFEAVWTHEVHLALHRSPSTAFVARRGGQVVAFACHGVYRPDLFGPIGTSAGERGSGVGAVLLRACLADMAGGGLGRAQIGWIGPARFYATTVGARIGRCFAMMRKDLEGEP